MDKLVENVGKPYAVRAAVNCSEFEQFVGDGEIIGWDKPIFYSHLFTIFGDRAVDNVVENR